MKNNLTQFITISALAGLLGACGSQIVDVTQKSPSSGYLEMGESQVFEALCRNSDMPTLTDQMTNSLGSVQGNCQVSAFEAHATESGKFEYSYTVDKKPGTDPVICSGWVYYVCSVSFTRVNTHYTSYFKYFGESIVQVTPSSSESSPIYIYPGESQGLKTLLNTIDPNNVGVTMTIESNPQNLSFINNTESGSQNISKCTITGSMSTTGNSCPIYVQASSSNPGSSSLTNHITVSTAGYPKRNVYIRVIPNSADSKYIFVSESQTLGDFGGFASADDICNRDSMISSHPSQLQGKTFKALLSGNNATTVGVTYKNLNESTIALATTTNLVESGIGITNAIAKPSAIVWTGLADSDYPVFNCQNWTSQHDYGNTGSSGETTSDWSVSAKTYCGSVKYGFYCVQQ